MVTISLDLETWGKRPGCDIRSIGAVVFSVETGLVHDGSLGTIRPFYIACDNPVTGSGTDWVATVGFRPNILDPQYDPVTETYRQYPLHRDPDTVRWWSEQSEAAQAAFTDPVDLREALERFTMWLIRQSADREQPVITRLAMDHYEWVKLEDLKIYAHGPQFDISILEAAYHAVGLPVPWHYRAPRDTRTVFDMAGITDHSAWLAQHATGTVHHALDDAICQARAVCAAWNRRNG